MKSLDYQERSETAYPRTGGANPSEEDKGMKEASYDSDYKILRCSR